MVKSKASSKSNLDKIRDHFNASGGGSDNRWFKVPEPERGQESRTNVRILPAWGKGAIVEGTKFFYYRAGLHYGFEIGSRNRALSCPESVGRGPCPVCKFISKLKKNGEHEELVQKIRRNDRYWVNLIDRSNPEEIKIYGGNKKFIEAILDASDDHGDITDPETGHDITIIRKGRGFQTRYRFVVRSKESVVKYDPKDLHKLDEEVVEWMSYKDMVQYLMDNYSDELNEVGLSFKIKDEKTVVNKNKHGSLKSRKVEKDESIDEDIDEEDGDSTEDIEEGEELEEEVEEEEVDEELEEEEE